MAVAHRLRVARRQRQGRNWTRVLVVGILAAVGGAVLWNGLEYSAAHDHAASSVRRSMEQVPTPATMQGYAPYPDHSTSWGRTLGGRHCSNAVLANLLLLCSV
jgi:hypothetical protein